MCLIVAREPERSNIAIIATFCVHLMSTVPGIAPITNIIGRAKRAPHWGVQSRFRVIYIYYVVGMSYVYRMLH